jgi:hypothetical protein
VLYWQLTQLGVPCAVVALVLTLATALDWIEAFINRGACTDAEARSLWEQKEAVASRTTVYEPAGELVRNAARRPSPSPNR